MNGSSLALARVGLALLSFAVFVPCLSNDFINWDDFQYLHLNDAALRLDLPAIFGQEVVGNYHPISVLSLALEHRLFGLDPFWFHLDNVLLHVANTLLVALLLGRLAPESPLVALAAAALFAVHPMHVESVAWVAERKDLLSTLFYLAALLAQLRLAASRRWGWYAAVLVFAGLALLSKPMAVTLPLALLAVDHCRGRRWSPGLVVEKLPVFAMALAAGLRTLQAQALVDPERYWLYGLDLPGRVVLAAQSLVFYVSKLVLPIRLSAYYDTDLVGVAPWQYAVALAAGLVAAAIAWRAGGTRSVPLFGIAFFGLTLAPTLKLVPFGTLSVFNDRYVYLPSVGFFLAVAWPLSRTARLSPRARAAVLAGCALILAVFSVQTYQRAHVWRSSRSFAEDVLRKYPGTAPVLVNLGQTYLSEEPRDLDRAYDLFEEATRARPSYENAWFNLGDVQAMRGDVAAAARSYERAVALNPNDFEHRFELGGFYEQAAQLEKASEHLEAAVRIEPRFGLAHRRLGDVYRRLGETARAEAAYRRAAALGVPVEPGDPAAQ